MKLQFQLILFFPLFSLGLAMLTGLNDQAIPRIREDPLFIEDPLRAAAFRIIDQKCNSCHRRQNPFMVFRPSRLEKRARRIHRAVFIDRRMPKSDGEPLTTGERDTLLMWLQNTIE